jgi:serine/threonine protein kinase
MQSGYLLRNRYRIEQRLSAGAFGETYIAVDENPDYPIERKVVVKHLKPQDNDPKMLEVARELFEKEAKILAKLGETTDRIPTLYAYFEEKEKEGEPKQSEFYLVQ